MSLAPLVEAIEALPHGRRLIALAGPPASGKSTLAARLVAALGPKAALVPMDGFHLDNTLLDARDLRARKGAPETFDLGGLTRLVTALKTGTEEVIAPTFDRARDIAIAGVTAIGPEVDTVVLEGNYLLFDAPGWRALHPAWDLSLWLDVPLPELTTRLLARWADHGLTPEAARVRAETNDVPNARRVMANRLPADITLTPEDIA